MTNRENDLSVWHIGISIMGIPLYFCVAQLFRKKSCATMTNVVAFLSMVCKIMCMTTNALERLQHQTLQWRHNERDSVSNHQPRHCLLNCLFRRGSKKTSKLRVNGFCAGPRHVTIPLAPRRREAAIFGGRPRFGAPGGEATVTRLSAGSDQRLMSTWKMFPFDDVIMMSKLIMQGARHVMGKVVGLIKYHCGGQILQVLFSC